MIKNSKIILLVGSEGYIGSVLRDELIKKKFHIIGIDNLIYKNQINSLRNKNYTLIKKDINKISLKKLKDILLKVSHVIYLAGMVGDPITRKYKKRAKYNNEDVIINFIKRCKKYFTGDKFIYISTCSNYGLRDNKKLAVESSELKPISFYSKSKVKLEKFLLSQKKIKFNPVVLRFATAFGLSPRMRFDLTVNQFTRDAFYKKEISIYDQYTWRPYCHVNDFSRLIIKVINTKSKLVRNQVFNAGSSKNNLTKRMLFNLIKKKSKVQSL
jgi:nucleoside-diphosphate-sugar epimerase